ncbi:MAG: CRISPR-associated endonuclease Cas2 [Clostridiales bacterium]|nr:CRISPR-associated endonuclease Cas2 [Clostridiales bacterium]
MRLIVFFDLPAITLEGRKAAARFRRFLIKQGFVMLQCSVYMRTVHNSEESEKYVAKIESGRPKEGDVRCLKISEFQYSSIYSSDETAIPGMEELVEI